jgi:hypothetical protein
LDRASANPLGVGDKTDDNILIPSNYLFTQVKIKTAALDDDVQDIHNNNAESSKLAREQM